MARTARNSTVWLAACLAACSLTFLAEDRASSAAGDGAKTEAFRSTRRGKPRVFPPRPAEDASPEVPEPAATKPMPATPAAPPANTSKPSGDTPKEGAKDKEAENASGIGRFLRVTRDKKGQPLTLETSVVRYVPADGKQDVAVDLVGAVHIGDKQYYRDLNKLFDTYDVVLFELVMAEGTKLPDGKGRGDGGLAGMLKSTLDLESQVEKIDYTKKNFVHADLSPQKMGEAMRKRGDTGLTLTLSVFTDMMREANRREAQARKNPAKRTANEFDLFGALFAPDSHLRMKRLMADQMEESGDANAFGPTLSTLLIDDRNTAAAEVLDREIKKGHKKIAIYYGAAHMPDFDKRLTGAFKLKADKTTWLKAWDMTK